MESELKDAVINFIGAFEQVFDSDWNYTKEQLGIQCETDEQQQNSIDIGFETIPTISANGTFLSPMITDTKENWGNRSKLLEEYAQLNMLLSRM